jgi:hypothetical protein
MKLISITKSKKPDKKFDAIFEDNGRTKTTSFGAIQNGKPMDDYTITHDKEQRDRYRARHAKDLKTNDPTRAGFLSYYCLWGSSISLHKNIATYKNVFNL